MVLFVFQKKRELIKSKHKAIAVGSQRLPRRSSKEKGMTMEASHQDVFKL